jgi:hypothetical protein
MLRILRDYTRDNFYKKINFYHLFLHYHTMKKLNSNWIAGFIDGDGTFALEKVGGFYRPVLSLAQNDPQLLYKIKNFFGCGTVTKKKGRSWHYRCRSAEQFQKYIIPKLGKGSFQTIKQYQYDLICNDAMPLLTNLKHPNLHALLESCLKKIQNSRNIAYVNPNTPINNDWFWGFFESEGHFSIRYSANFSISYKVTQKNRALLEKIMDFFGFGVVQSQGVGRSLKYNVEGIQKVCQYGLPILLKNPLNGQKNLQRVKFIKALRIISSIQVQSGVYSIKGASDNERAKLKKLAEDIVKIRKRKLC